MRTSGGHRAVTPRRWHNDRAVALRRVNNFQTGIYWPCADPGIFVRGGGPGQSDKKRSDNRFFSPQLILLKSNGLFRRKLSFFKVPEGVQHFPGESIFFQGGWGGGSNCLFPIETHITCDFPEGGPDPLSPLWISTCWFSSALCFISIFVFKRCL